MHPGETLGRTRTPVVLILFKRPEETARVFDMIRRAQPSQIFLIADGPRRDRPEDRPLCEAARAVVEHIDWDCRVQRNYSEENMGCGRRLPSGLDWVFEQVEEAIILEDDCVPDPSFFRYCDVLLERFRADSRVMHINGNSFGGEAAEMSPYSYGFTHFAQAWGWATWRRAWQAFDHVIASWPEYRDRGWIESLPVDGAIRRRQVERWDLVHGGALDIWDFQWHFAVMSQHGLAVAPSVNLVSNVGFGPDATHTLDTTSPRAALPTAEMPFPLRHPPFVQPHPATDRRYARAMMGGSRLRRLVRRIRTALHLHGR